MTKREKADGPKSDKAQEAERREQDKRQEQDKDLPRTGPQNEDAQRQEPGYHGSSDQGPAAQQPDGL